MRKLFAVTLLTAELLALARLAIGWAYCGLQWIPAQAPHLWVAGERAADSIETVCKSLVMSNSCSVSSHQAKSSARDSHLKLGRIRRIAVDFFRIEHLLAFLELECPLEIAGVAANRYRAIEAGSIADVAAGIAGNFDT